MSDRLFKLMLIDDDPIFRLGLLTWLEQFPDLQVLAEADTGSTALQILETRNGIDTPTPEGEAIASPELANATLTENPQLRKAEPVDLVILDLSLGRSANQSIGLTLCQQIKNRYPKLPILLLSSPQDLALVTAARQVGANGYCLKGMAISELVAVIRQVATGQSYWQQAISPVEPPSVETIDRSSEQPSPTLPVSEQPLSAFGVLRRNLRLSGLQQIEAVLAQLNTQLQNPALSLVDRAIVAGRCRELLAARWVVKQLLATPEMDQSQRRSRGEPIRQPLNQTSLSASSQPARSSRLDPAVAQVEAGQNLPLAQGEGAATSLKTLRSLVFDATLFKLQSNLQNFTDTALEIDILKPEKKRELLYIILRKLEDLLDELRFSQVQPNQLAEKRSLLLKDLWSAATVDFFGKYYTVRVNNRNIDQDLEVTNILLQDAEIVRVTMLDKVPLVTDLFAHLLFQTPLIIDQDAYAAGTAEAMARTELLMQNLLIQVANAIAQPLLNRLANVEAIKQNFYDHRLLSTREIERFRNNLSWQYRTERLVGEPKAIFEDRFRLFVLSDRGIDKISIHAPRQQELEALSGISLAITIILETRDAIAPRVRSAISFVGSGVVYVLTEVVGRGIGLIGRGILKGVGSAWQDSKFTRDGNRPK